MSERNTTFTEIGGSPVSGLTLRHVLRGHTDWIGRSAWSPNGAYLASPSADETVRIWDSQSGACLRTLQGHTDGVWSVAWSPDGQRLASASDDNTLRLWDAADGKLLETLQAHVGSIYCVAWSPDGRRLATGSFDKTVCLWNADLSELLQTLREHTDSVTCMAWSPDGQRLVSASIDKTLRLWDTASGMRLQTLEGHTAPVYGVAWSPNGRFLASASADRTVRVWDGDSGKMLQVLEGHESYVGYVNFAADGRWLVSKSDDNTIRLWRCDYWACVSVLGEPTSSIWPPGLAFHPRLPMLATLGEQDTIVRIWDLDEAALLGGAQQSIHYITAKLVLIGDPGVGKSGLGWRLAHGKFEAQSSPHGQWFWPIRQLGLTRAGRVQCEAVLWDLATQSAYWQINPIFLENITAGLALFDPTNRQDPLRRVQFWLEQLKGKGELPPAVLVGARVDRGAPASSQQEIEQFCQRYGVRGGYVGTSAQSGEGLDALLDVLKALIPWNDMTATVTTVAFKRIKDYLLALKERPDRVGVLVSQSALREQLQATDPDWSIRDDEMMTAVGHLETHGYVAVLRSTADERYILLAPDLLATLAASIVSLADKHPRELGALNEADLVQGKYPFAALAGLPLAESQVLLDAAILRFLEHNVCFRETMGEETLLIFPGLIKQKRPLQDDLPTIDDISYMVRGRVENLYDSLVVLIGYTPSFTRINHWQNQAQYEMAAGEICGFRMSEERQGEIELVLYYGDKMPDHGCEMFRELFERLLYQRGVDITPFPPISCSNSHRQERTTVIRRVRENKRFIFCAECGIEVKLPDFDKPQGIGISASPWLQREEAEARLRSAYEVQLTKVKSYRRSWAAPRCYISHMPKQTAWAEDLIRDLREAGVYIVEQAAQVQPDDFVFVVETPAYQRAFESGASTLTSDAPLIRERLGKTDTLIALALKGQPGVHQIEDCGFGRFYDETHYLVGLFDLVLKLYSLPREYTDFKSMRQTLHEQWERTLAGKGGADVTTPLKLFISYSHEDEPFKDELIKMLAGLQRRGIIDIWHDRRIEAGDEWYTSIQDAMNNCDLAVLFVSKDFIASRFIQDDELPRLFQRRQEHGLRVIPIIVRPCGWRSEPVLKDLLALPRDGKPVITFSEENGDREQEWLRIAAVIETRAKARATP